MKVLVTILAILNGGYMFLDGIYVLLKGKYIGTERPGPWSLLFEKWNIDIILIFLNLDHFSSLSEFYG